MLSNNEFVFTADAVRGMGGGDVNLGAQRMYDTDEKIRSRRKSIMAEVVRTAPAEFIEAGAKTYLDDLTKAIGQFKTTDLSTIMGPQFVAGPGALTTQAESLATGLGGFQPFLTTSTTINRPYSLSSLYVSVSTRCY